jgi:nicotinamidase-related amidase
MASIRSNHATSRFSKDDSALLLIDHQSGTMQLNHDPSHLEFQAHTKQAAAK